MLGDACKAAGFGGGARSRLGRKMDLWAHGGGVRRSLVGTGASWWRFRVLVMLLA